MNSLNKVVIFGATSGIAEQAARQLVREGASVFCVARNAEKLDALLTDLRVRGQRLADHLPARPAQPLVQKRRERHYR